jgi:hypothetical protein
MRQVIISLLLLGGVVVLSATEASAIVCARGVYRAGCVGSGNGAVVVRHPVARGYMFIAGSIADSMKAA